MVDPPPTPHEGDLVPEARAFGSVAARYERGRPSYAPEAVAALAEALGWSAQAPPPAPVLDLGAGTGKFTRLIAELGVPVIAVEPLAEMRTRIPPSPRVTVLDGSAQAIPLQDGACGAAVSAAAFHWFAGPAALAEIVRVTRPPHRLGLLWNNRDRGVGWVDGFEAIMARHATSAPRARDGAWREALRAFGADVGECRRFPNPHPTTRDGVVDRGLSTSFIAALDDDGRAGVEAELRELAATLPARLDFPYVTEVYVVELGWR